MPIQGLTGRPPQFPCIGTLHKGAAKPERGPGRDLDHFRFDTDAARAAEMFQLAYGDTPRAITVYLPYPTVDQNFQAWRESWTASKLNHRCDGEVCYEYNQRGELAPTTKPCPDMDKPRDDRTRCKQVGRLQVILPVLERFAYVTVLTSSIYDIVALSEQLSAIEALRGSLQGIPMVLSRNEREISMPKPDGSRARVAKWMLAIEVAPEWASLQLQSMQRQALQLPAPMPLSTLTALTNSTMVDTVTEEIVNDEEEATFEIVPDEAPAQRQPRDLATCATCASCGATIAWAKTKNGKNCPYDVDSNGVRTDVAHFETCPNAAQHSGKQAPAKDFEMPEMRQAMVKKIRQQMHQLGDQVTADDWALDLEEMTGAELVVLGKQFKARLERQQPALVAV